MADDAQRLTPKGVHEYADFSPKTEAEWAHVKKDAATLASSLDRASERLKVSQKKD